MKEYKPAIVALTLVAIMVIGTAIYGVHLTNEKLDLPLEENFYKWEYSSFYPLTATVDELLQAEKTLRTNGYTRVVIRPKYKETWTAMERVGTEIFATRLLPEFQKGKEITR